MWKGYLRKRKYIPIFPGNNWAHEEFIHIQSPHFQVLFRKSRRDLPMCQSNLCTTRYIWHLRGGVCESCTVSSLLFFILTYYPLHGDATHWRILVCCQKLPSLYLNQCWLEIIGIHPSAISKKMLKTCWQNYHFKFSFIHLPGDNGPISLLLLLLILHHH